MIEPSNPDTSRKPSEVAKFSWKRVSILTVLSGMSALWKLYKLISKVIDFFMEFKD